MRRAADAREAELIETAAASGMSITTETPATLRQIVLDSLHDAYWAHRNEIESCSCCRSHPAGACIDHQDDDAAARSYEDARMQIERSPGSPEVLAVLADLNGGEKS